MHKRWLSAPHRPFEGGSKLGCIFNRFTMTTKSARKGGKIRIDKIRSGNTARMLALLVHANSAIDAIINNEHDNIGPMLHCGAELLHGHLQAAIASKADDIALRISQLRRDSSG